jgi:hypothetical protein
MITTKVEIENYLITTIDASFNSQIDLWISAMQEYIHTLANRKVVADDATSVNLYTGNNAPTLFIDDFLTITQLKYGGDIVDSADYVAKPFNLPFKNQLKWLTGATWYKYKEGDIEVTGRRGMYDKANIPEDIRWACMILVAGIVQSSSNDNKNIQSETIGRYTVAYKTDTQKMDYKNAIEIARSYRRASI